MKPLRDRDLGRAFVRAALQVLPNAVCSRDYTVWLPGPVCVTASEIAPGVVRVFARRPPPHGWPTEYTRERIGGGPRWTPGADRSAPWMLAAGGVRITLLRFELDAARLAPLAWMDRGSSITPAAAKALRALEWRPNAGRVSQMRAHRKGKRRAA